MDEKEFKEIGVLLEKKKKLLETTNFVHLQAYTEAAQKYLKDEGDQLNLNKLDNTDVQEKFAKHMADHYLKNARKALGVKESKGKLEDEMLLQAYAGTTTHQLLKAVGDSAHDYNITAHAQIGQQLQRQQDARLTDVIYGNVRQEHMGAIVKYMDAESYVRPDRLDVNAAARLIGEYFSSGKRLPEDVVKGRPYHLKKDMKEAA